jgi:3-mercaptopyruvate sulfurtransferase SseA
MKILKQALAIAISALVAGILFNLVFATGINPFGSFTGDIDISKDHRAIMNINDVVTAFENSNTVFIDARDEKDYLAGHIPRALNAPYFYMERAYSLIADKILRADTIIFYGADEKDIAPLRSADYYNGLPGFKNIQILYGGISKWKAAGLPIDRGDENGK